VFWEAHRAEHPAELEALRLACVNQAAALQFDAKRAAETMVATAAAAVTRLDCAILLWHFADAPEVFRRLSPHGGDEDFVALVPAGVDPPGWTLWWQDVTRHELADGAVLLIGVHA